jgi:hypothetical protein
MFDDSKEVQSTNCFNSSFHLDVYSKRNVKNWIFLRLRDLWTNPYDSRQIEPFWIFVHELNPRIKSFEKCITNRIHELNLLNAVGRIKSTKQIFWTPHRHMDLRDESMGTRFPYTIPATLIFSLVVID